MNATILILSAAWIAGADAPAAPAPAAPVVMSSAGCGGCDSAPAAVCGDSCGPRLGLFARIKAKLSSLKPTCHHSSCAAPSCAAPAPMACAPAPSCAPACGTPLISKPLFTGFTTSACGCGSSKIGLFDRLKARFSHSSSCSAPCDSGCSAPASSGCSTGPALVAPVAPVAPPKEMPKPKDEPVKPKTTASAPELKIPELGGTAGKY